MKCMKCSYETSYVVITDIFESDTSILVIKNVPCNKCTNCGNTFYSADVAVNVDRFKENFKSTCQEMGIIDYSKAARKYKWCYVI